MFVHANPDCLSFLPNVNTGINTVLRSISFEVRALLVIYFFFSLCLFFSLRQAGDEILLLSTEYEANKYAVDFLVETVGVQTVILDVLFPPNYDAILADVEEALSANKKLRWAIFDHITSSSGMILPVKDLVRVCHAHDVMVLVVSN